MIRKIEASQRHTSDFGWLKTSWLFSFDDYYDPENTHFGALRVFNDDIVLPGNGFPMHQHREMEIITLVLEGELTHEDSLGNRGVIRAGDVQRMSAGTGITHSEYNLGAAPVHLYQVWIYPGERGLAPSYDQRSFAGADRTNRLLAVASGRGLEDVVTFHADATIYVSELQKGASVNAAADRSRRVFVYVTSGQVEIEGLRFGEQDQARVEPEGNVNIVALAPASLVVIDAPTRNG